MLYFEHKFRIRQDLGSNLFRNRTSNLSSYHVIVYLCTVSKVFPVSRCRYQCMNTLTLLWLDEVNFGGSDWNFTTKSETLRVQPRCAIRTNPHHPPPTNGKCWLLKGRLPQRWSGGCVKVVYNQKKVQNRVGIVEGRSRVTSPFLVVRFKVGFLSVFSFF